MGQIKSYKDLIVWQKSIKLVTMIYKLSEDFPETEKFGLTSQIQRASVSIPSNIAEGWGRFSQKDYIRFLRIARGSLFEVETQLEIAKNLKYIDDYSEAEQLMVELSKMINAIVKKLT